MEYDKIVESICRTCLAQNVPLNSVFEAEIFDDYSVRMTDYIRNLTSIKMARGDGLPENVCVSCVEQICKAYAFTKRCIASDATLRTQCNQSTLFETQIVENLPKFENNEAEKSESPEDSEIIVVDEELETKHESQCDNSSKSFVVNDTLAEHNFSKLLRYPTTSLSIHSHTEEKNFVCQQCGEKFSYLYLLDQHKFKHTLDKPYPCTECKKGCLTAESLRRHMKVHDINRPNTNYVCEICHKIFTYPSFLAEHSKMHTGEKPFLCSLCGKSFRQKGALAYHIRTHTGFKPHKCQICDNSFISKSVLTSHMRRHSDERPFVCDVCGMAFRQSSDMKGHLRIHAGNKRVICTLCGKYMSTTGQLTVHLRSHTGEKPFECDVCSKAFTTRTLLVKHGRIHTGEKPYECKICGRAFNQSSSLKSHEHTHKTNLSDVYRVVL